MSKIFRVLLSALVTLAVALTAAVALSAPAQAMTVDDNANTNPIMQNVKVTLDEANAGKVAVSWHWAEALCGDASTGVVTTSKSWFSWSAPTPNGIVGVSRCAWDLYDCVKLGGRSVIFENYAGPMGWSYWQDTCS